MLRSYSVLRIIYMLFQRAVYKLKAKRGTGGRVRGRSAMARQLYNARWTCYGGIIHIVDRALFEPQDPEIYYNSLRLSYSTNTTELLHS